MSVTGIVCSELGCKRAAAVKGKCTRHYQQLYRGRLGKVREVSADGEGVGVSFRCHVDLKRRIKKQAKAEKREPSELWREGAELLLKGRGGGKP